MKIERFEELKGQRLAQVRQIGDDRLVFELEDGREYSLFHESDCCESVTIESVVGDLADLVGEVLIAEESSNNENKPNEYADSWTWTFYRIGTIKGSVVIRWLGESNGYYSESVTFA